MNNKVIILTLIALIDGCSNLDTPNNVVNNSKNDQVATADGVNSLFRDGWNLDAGLDSRPIGSLVVTIHTSDKFLAGTDCDIYFGMKLSDGRVIEKLIDKEGYNDFEQSDLDDYFLYVRDQTFYPNLVTSMWLRSVKKGIGPDWHIDYIKVFVNGKHVYYKRINSWISGNSTYTMSPVYLPTAQDIPVPIN